MDDFMHQCAAPGGDVHDQRPVLRRIIAEWRRGRLVEQAEGVVRVAGPVAEQPDVDDLRRVAREILLLEAVHGPFHGLRRAHLHGGGRFIADHHKGRLDHHRKTIGDTRLQPGDVFSKTSISRGFTRRRGRTASGNCQRNGQQTGGRQDADAKHVFKSSAMTAHDSSTQRRQNSGLARQPRLRRRREQLNKSSFYSPQKIRRTDNRDALKLLQCEQMLFIAAYDVIRFRRQSTFQNHFITGIGRRPRDTFRGKNQFSRFGQGIYPFNRLAPGIVQPKLLDGFVILGQQRWADHGFAAALRPGRQTVKRRAAPKAGTRHHIGVEDHSHTVVSGGLPREAEGLLRGFSPFSRRE